jgi:hypothetical protein
VQAIARLQREVATRAGVAGRLLARTDDSTTWMEIYEGVMDVAHFDRVLADAEAQAGASAFAVDGARHVERFAPLADRD